LSTYATPGRVLAYSCTVGISIDPAILVPQWQMNTPIRGFCAVVLPVVAFTGAGAAAFALGVAAGACFLTSCFTGASFFASCFLVTGFLVVDFFFSAIFTTSQNLLQERFAADPMKIQPEVLRTHSLCQSKEFSEVKDGQVIGNTKLLLDLDLAAVELELTERADIGECIYPLLFQVDQLLVGDIQ